MVKKTKGRQKIPIARIAHRSNLQVTFSKRRSGLFKKASEISTLCGADVALIVFSPAEKVFSYGNPSVDTVVDRFLEGTGRSSPPPEMMMMQLIQEERHNAVVFDQNLHLDHVLGLLEDEKRRGDELSRAMEADSSHEWWKRPTEELTLEQLELLKVQLLGLKSNIESQKERVILEMSTQPQPPPPPPPPQPVPYFGMPGSSHYGVDAVGGGFGNFADPGPSGQVIPQPYYNMGYEQQQQGFY